MSGELESAEDVCSVKSSTTRDCTTSVSAEIAAAVFDSDDAPTGLASTELTDEGLASEELASPGPASTGLVSEEPELPPTNATPYSSVSLLTLDEPDPQFVITPFEAQSQ